MEAKAKVDPKDQCNWLDGYTVGSVSKQQLEDPDIALVLSFKETSDRKPDKQKLMAISNFARSLILQWDHLVILDGVLAIRKDPVRASDQAILQLVVPRTLKRELCEQLHAVTTAGHLGVTCTLAKVRSQFCWPGMKEIMQWCKSCETCSRTKMRYGKPQAEMIPIVCGNPLDRIALDIMGPSPITHYGNQYIMAVGDYFTKWIEC